MWQYVCIRMPQRGTCVKPAWSRQASTTQPRASTAVCSQRYTQCNQCGGWPQLNLCRLVFRLVLGKCLLKHVPRNHLNEQWLSLLQPSPENRSLLRAVGDRAFIRGISLTELPTLALSRSWCDLSLSQHSLRDHGAGEAVFRQKYWGSPSSNLVSGVQDGIPQPCTADDGSMLVLGDPPPLPIEPLVYDYLYS